MANTSDKAAVNRAIAARSEAVELALGLSKRAMRVIAEVMETAEKASDRLAAAREILDRAHGKATQQTNVSHTVNHAAAQLAALNALTGQLVPIIDHNPLEALGNQEQSPKEFINVTPVSSLSDLTSAVTSSGQKPSDINDMTPVSPADSVRATPPASPGAPGDL
jgi:hypothetical protein